MFVALDLPPLINDHLAWWVAGLIVVLGLLVYGFFDVLRFSPSRTWAISSVVFAESIRRRVWLILILAIPACIIVSQLQHPIDEQDAIRQTTKFCLFTAGLVVTVTAIILACTNLPREIDNRVIYTVVTKPTTRLEIVLGKVLGFARVSAAILIVMGIFTFIYLETRAAILRNYIVQRLETNAVDTLSRPALEHYKDAGLLSARVYDRPDDLQVYSRVPVSGDERRFMFGGAEGQFVVPFEIPPELMVDPNDPNMPNRVGILLKVGFERSEFDVEDPSDPGSARPTTVPWLIQNPDATPEQVKIVRRGRDTARPSVTLEILDLFFNTLVEPSQINHGAPVLLSDPTGQEAIFVPITPEGVAQLSRASHCYVAVNGNTGDYEYFAGTAPLLLVTGDGQEIRPVRDPFGTGGRVYALPTFRSRSGTYGQQLRGGERQVPIALFKFRDAQINPDEHGNIPFELKVGVERASTESVEDQATRVEVRLVDRNAGDTLSEPILVYPETNRTAYFNVPASLITGKDFDVLVQCRTKGQYVGVANRSLSMVIDDESFGYNLLKSLLILWLLSILVVIVSIFCSTFLSWPIAIVLTILILLGHWGVKQLGDSLAPGIGNLVVTDLFRGADAPTSRTISSTVEVLSRALDQFSRILPDISRFSALDDMERGVAIPASRLKEALGVIGLFGIPMIVLAYVILRRKEVAP